MAVTRRNTFLQRLIGAAALDAAIYEEVEADASATSQAFAVVLLSSIAAGFGAGDLRGPSIASVVFISVLALLSWAAWAVVTLEVGTRILPGAQTRADVGQLLRTIGFASTPGLLRFLGMMPSATVPVFAVTSVWMLAAMVVAVRQALDYQSTGRAVAVCALGWILALILAIGLGVLFGPSVQ
ncbi:MAG: YIP1 family protein [Vicinamibacterales bacterium]